MVLPSIPMFSASTGHPFYIVAPPYTRMSAGIRCLHLLCHCLNLRGQPAYLLQDPAAAREGQARTAAVDFLTPFLTDEIARTHFSQGRTPSVVYPETVSGNPYRADCIVRFVAHFPGFLGGDKTFPADELCFGFSQNLAAAAGAPGNVLFIPSVDTGVFRPPERPLARSGSCFYADKYRKVHGAEPFEITRRSVEIKRYERGAQEPHEIARLFQTSEVFYTYENTALAIEAVLCGCPAVFLPNPYLTEIISLHELGREGYAWGDSPEQLAFARSTVGQGARNYHALVESFWLALDRFIAKSTAHARNSSSASPILTTRFEKRASAADGIVLALVRALPPGAALEVAKGASTFGLRRVGSMLWNDTVNRARADERRIDCTADPMRARVGKG